MALAFSGASRALSKERVLVVAIAVFLISVPAATSAAVRLHAPIELTSPNAQNDSTFGTSVAIDGRVMVVGAPYEGAGGQSQAGAAYIIRSGVTYTLASPSPQLLGQFGDSVATANGQVVVGAPNENSSMLKGAGDVYIFSEKSGTMVRTLTSPNVQQEGAFGGSVAIGSGIIVVGAPLEDAGGYHQAGRVYVFGAQTGSLLYTLESPNTQDEGGFGSSVAVSGTVLVVGAPGEDVGVDGGAGNAYTFVATSGTPSCTLTSPNPGPGGAFGLSVAAWKGVVVVGEPGADLSGYLSVGDAYTFSSSTCMLAHTLLSTNEQETGLFGISVAAGSGVVVVGAEGENVANQGYSGRAYVFGASSGTLRQTLTSPNAQAQGNFGSSVAADSYGILVGAAGETFAGLPGAGHAYEY